MEEDCGMPAVGMDFSRSNTSTDVNRLFTGTTVRGVLEEKHYRNLDSVFPFVAAFIDRARGFPKNAPMTVINSLYSALIRLSVNSRSSMD